MLRITSNAYAMIGQGSQRAASTENLHEQAHVNRLANVNEVMRTLRLSSGLRLRDQQRIYL